MNRDDWNQYEAKPCADYVGSVVESMLTQRDDRIEELEKQVDDLEKEIDQADASAVGK